MLAELACFVQSPPQVWGVTLALRRFCDHHGRFCLILLTQNRPKRHKALEYFFAQKSMVLLLWRDWVLLERFLQSPGARVLLAAFGDWKNL